MTAMIEALAQDARCIDDEDWGSARQSAAQDGFFDHVRGLMRPMVFEEFEMWCLKATTDEMIDEGLRLLREA